MLPLGETLTIEPAERAVLALHASHQAARAYTCLSEPELEALDRRQRTARVLFDNGGTALDSCWGTGNGVTGKAEVELHKRKTLCY